VRRGDFVDFLEKWEGVFLRIFIDESNGKKVRTAESVVSDSHSDSQNCEILLCQTQLSLMVIDDFVILSAHSFPSMFW
jgi:hypothetical protein